MAKLLLSLLLAVAGLPFAKASNTGNLVLNQIRSHHKGIAVWWMGNAGWLIKSDGLLIGTDLTLDNDEKIQPPPLTAAEIAPDLDVVFVTHHHSDHCNPETLRILAQRGKCIFVLPQPCLKELTGIHIPTSASSCPSRSPFHGQDRPRVEPIHAIHGNRSSPFSHENPISWRRLLITAATYSELAAGASLSLAIQF